MQRSMRMRIGRLRERTSIPSFRYIGLFATMIGAKTRTYLSPTDNTLQAHPVAGRLTRDNRRRPSSLSSMSAKYNFNLFSIPSYILFWSFVRFCVVCVVLNRTTQKGLFSGQKGAKMGLFRVFCCVVKILWVKTAQKVVFFFGGFDYFSYLCSRYLIKLLINKHLRL